MGLSNWQAESNKRALLAQIGVGTVDQSVLSVLRNKFSTLRLFGLLGKVLIIDEVHAYDSYLIALLKNLLRAQAQWGGSVILLSATLPANTRSELMGCYWEALFPDTDAPGSRIAKIRGTKMPETLSAAYPLLSMVNAAGLQEIAVDATELAHRSVAVEYLTDRESVAMRLIDAARGGQCAAWIRNTVGEAQASYREIKARDASLRVTLFHSRFALIDRQRIEAHVVQQFGPKSDPAARRGQIVIATQVIEHSLDLDFDVLVSDLAPIDLLLQRLGRLRRHARDASGNRVQGADQRGPLSLVVHGPDRDSEPQSNWLRAFSPGSAMIYPNHGQIYASAKALGAGFELPAQQRELIEAEYGPTLPVAPNLQAASDRAEGKDLGDGYQAQLNLVKWQQAYLRTENDWPDDTRAPTRLGDPTVEVALAFVKNVQIAPWAQTGERYDRWPLSVVKMRRNQICARAALPD